MIMNDTDFMDDRILSSAKASTSTGSTHTNLGVVCTLTLWRGSISWKLKYNCILFLGRKRMSQVIKRRNKSKKNSFSKSIFGGESTNVATTPADIDTIIETYVRLTQNINLDALIPFTKTTNYNSNNFLFSQPTPITVHMVMI